jgi:hypothetical protein
MSVIATLDYRLQTLSPQGLGLAQTNQSRWAPGAGVGGVRETITLAASVFTAISVPTGSKAIIIILGSATSLTLKGATGDATGIALCPATNPTGLDLIMPLGASPSIGILNGLASPQNIEVILL